MEPLHDCAGAFTGNPCGACYVCHLVQVFREVKRVLREEGTCWVNLGDTYMSGNRATGNAVLNKSLAGIPWRVALALQADGWILRSDIIWWKRNCMPSSVSDRVTTAHEYVFLLSKSPTYFFDGIAIREPYAADNEGACTQWVRGWASDGAHTAIAHNQPRSHKGSKFNRGKTGIHGQGRASELPRADHPNGRNARSVWDIPTTPFDGAHFACFAPELVRRCLLAGTSAYGCCAQCGMPWKRQVERQRLLDRQTPVHGAFSRSEEPFRMPANGIGHWRYTTQTTELGWGPSCACRPQQPVPCTVLDPFCGAATVPLVARALGLHVVGIDLSWPYLHDVARHRLTLDALAVWEGRQRGTQSEDYTGLPLFPLPGREEEGNQ